MTQEAITEIAETEIEIGIETEIEGTTEINTTEEIEDSMTEGEREEVIALQETVGTAMVTADLVPPDTCQGITKIERDLQVKEAIEMTMIDGILKIGEMTTRTSLTSLETTMTDTTIRSETAMIKTR